MRLSLDGVLDAVGRLLADQKKAADEELGRLAEVWAKLTAKVDELERTPGPAGPSGPPGAPGAAGLQGDRGFDGPPGLSMTPRGKWDPARIYKAGDICGWSGTSWFCTRATAEGEEPGKSDAFTIVVTRPAPGQKGERGAPGAPGAPGEPGRDGRNAPQLVGVRFEGRAMRFVLDDGGSFEADATPLIRELAETVVRHIARSPELLDHIAREAVR